VVNDSDCPLKPVVALNPPPIALPNLLRALYRDIVVFRESLLGSGATGLVFRGMYQGREVAIKVL